MICPSGKICALQSLDWPRTMKFPVCVHERRIVVKSRICRKPPQPGKCGAQFVRWYFNVHMGACSWFTYSGCGGNRNNFRTAEECERRCMRTDLRDQRRTNRGRQGSRDVVVEEGGRGDNQVDDSMNEGGREPITAPARAAEDIDLVITSGDGVSTKIVDPVEERKRRREQRRRERKERRRRRKELEKIWRSNRRNEVISRRKAGQTSPRPPAKRRQPKRKLTALELGPNYGLATSSPSSSSSSWSSSTSPTGRFIMTRAEGLASISRPGPTIRDSGRSYFEARERGGTRYDPDHGEDVPIWLMDDLLKQQDSNRTQHRRRHRNHHSDRADNTKSDRNMRREGDNISSRNSSRRPTVTISVHSYSKSDRHLSSLVDTPSDSSDPKSERNRYNQRWRARELQGTSSSSSRREDLRDSPTVARPARAGAPKLKPYYDKLHLFHILEDPGQTKLRSRYERST
ncbi:kunitz-type serine protease inhibitor [Plakobranchus ocellatus]|uniref:Kunitz-type serine protease inhibitor n=1 Tax=Plakobranchus ocellatus TaxID=259542 RepID=A0AAV4A9U7_9GAST|nr:kunitz-type serine protease inhibitor [Plakobranchus ocellatus]